MSCELVLAGTGRLVQQTRLIRGRKGLNWPEQLKAEEIVGKKTRTDFRRISTVGISMASLRSVPLLMSSMEK